MSWGGGLCELAAWELLVCHQKAAVGQLAYELIIYLRLKGPRAITLLCYTLKGMERKIDIERRRERTYNGF